MQPVMKALKKMQKEKATGKEPCKVPLDLLKENLLIVTLEIASSPAFKTVVSDNSSRSYVWAQHC